MAGFLSQKPASIAHKVRCAETFHKTTLCHPALLQRLDMEVPNHQSAGTSTYICLLATGLEQTDKLRSEVGICMQFIHDVT